MEIKTKMIPAGEFQGYYWWSDQETPEEVDGAFPGIILEDRNPFIVEAQLFDTANRVSYSVRYLDGVYDVHAVFVDELEDYSEKVFPASWNGRLHLRFVYNWRPVKDAMCEGMEVLMPAEVCFIGFNKEISYGRL